MILDQVKNTIKKHGLIRKGDKIVLGVSGGADSLTLLYILNFLKDEFHLGLYVAHLDHMLRRDSSQDRKFVQGIARKLKLPFIYARKKIGAGLKKGSLEEMARNARLEFLCRTAKKARAKKIALGHNFDDQAETVLMRILRGTGLYGLSGILPKRDIGGCTIIRPLLEVKRKEIEAFLRRKKIRPRLDASNLEDIYFRNRIRNRLLPLLESGYNKNIKEVLANLAQSAGCDYAYLSEVAGRSVKQIGSGINLKKLQKEHTAIRRMILRQAISRLKGDTRMISFQHIKELEDLILNRPENSVVDLPAGLEALKRKCLIFRRKKA